MGDLNSKAVEWGSPFTDVRGEYLNEWLNEENLTIHNNHSKPTCITPNGSSYIDITVSTGRFATCLCDWSVTEDESLSNHGHIQFSLSWVGGKRRSAQVDRKIVAIDKDKIKLGLRNSIERKGRPTSAGALVEIIRDAQNGGVTYTKGPKKVPYWWTQETDKARRRCIALRRRVMRVRPRQDDSTFCRLRKRPRKPKDSSFVNSFEVRKGGHGEN